MIILISFQKTMKKKKKKPKLCFATKGRSYPEKLPEALGPRRNFLFSLVSTFGEQCCRPSIPPSFPSGLSSIALRGTFTWSHVHGHSGAAPFRDWILNPGLVLTGSQLEFVFPNDFIITINSSESTCWLVAQCVCVLAIYIYSI